MTGHLGVYECTPPSQCGFPQVFTTGSKCPRANGATSFASMISIKSPHMPVVAPRSNGSLNHLSIKNHPAYCDICLNLNPETANSLVGLRGDIESKDARPSHPQYDPESWTRDPSLAATRPAWAGKGQLHIATWSAQALAQDILQRAENGCSTCQILEATMRGAMSDAVDIETPSIGIMFEFCVDFAATITLCRFDDIMDEEDEDENPDGMFNFETADPGKRSWQHIYAVYELFSRPDETKPWPTIGSYMTNPSGDWDGGQAGSVPVDPDNDQVFELVQNWLHDCGSSAHPNCEAIELVTLPTRVVDVGQNADNSEITLMVTNGLKAQYVALSHCWGLNPIITTRRENFDQHLAKIPYNDLSRTFQDAIKISRRLGIRYIWIDSLCIIQDSKSDWAQESARMADIYQNASLVLAATGSGDGAGGCLFPRRNTTEIKGLNLEGNAFSVFVRETCKHDIIDLGGLKSVRDMGISPNAREYISMNPLLGRAWCYQERLLASRMLHFTRDEIIWECLSCQNCECGRLSNFVGDKMVQVKRDARATSSPVQHLTEQQSLTTAIDHLDLWTGLVAQYTTKSITYATDILPAISSLAARFQRSSDITGCYVAGHWFNDLPRSLLWHVNHDESREKHLSRASNAAQGDEYLAPSWSWASVVFPVTWITEGNDMIYYIDVLEVEYTAQDVNSFGQVRKGSYLKVSAPLVPGELVSDPNHSSGSFYIKCAGWQCELAEDDVERCRSYSPGKVWCMRFAKEIRNRRFRSGVERAIVLVKVQGDEGKRGNVYRRLGILEYAPTDGEWVEETTKKEIIII